LLQSAGEGPRGGGVKSAAPNPPMHKQTLAANMAPPSKPPPGKTIRVYPETLGRIA
jgi:hypothetical protein